MIQSAALTFYSCSVGNIEIEESRRVWYFIKNDQDSIIISLTDLINSRKVSHGPKISHQKRQQKRLITGQFSNRASAIKSTPATSNSI